MEKPATIRDVAKEAGVSVATVSYVLNGINKVAPETKERILKIINELSYHPSHTARCLSNGKSKLIGISLPITEQGDVPGILLGNNPFFTEFLAGIENITREKGYDILLSGVNSNEQYMDWVQCRKLDALIMVGVYPKGIFEEIKKLEIPVVLIDIYEEYSSDYNRVMVDDEFGGYLATKHLIELGHTKIAFVSGDVSKSIVNSQRYDGYKKAFKDAGLSPQPDLLLEDHVDLNGGYKVGCRILNSGCEATAVCVMSDIMAIGLIKAFNESGKNIPDDLSVIGFDDIELGRFITPGLTTISQEINLKAKTAAEIIINDLGKGQRSNNTVIFKPKLVIRGTTAPLKR